jgi:hypothetical protein
MIINKDTYKLGLTNYIHEETIKNKILIGNTFTTNMNHYVGWVTRYNGKYKKTANYTIKLDGTIYEHFNPKYYSNFTDDISFDKTIISIVLENEGWLIKDLNDENKYINNVGNIYNRVDDIIIRKWRSNKYWAPYSEKQLESTIKLINKLCIEFDIPLEVISHNTKINKVNNYKGVLYRSNLNNYFTDVNPSWDFTNFKDKLEIN